MNTAITSRSGGNDGIGFAIPSDMVRRVVNDIIDDGHVTRGYMGVRIQPLTEDLASSFGLDEDTDGVLVADVVSDGPADDAGLEPGDIIVSIDDESLMTPSELLNIVGGANVGDDLDVQVMRDGRKRTFGVTLVERPTVEQLAGGSSVAPKTSQKLGMAVEALTPEVAGRFDLDESQGVVVSGVAPGGTAAEVDLRRGDVILKIGSTKVTDPEQFWSVLAGEDMSKGVRLLVQRGAAKQFIVLKLEDD